MPQWSLLSEYIALLLTGLLASFFYDSRQDSLKNMSHKRMLFWRCIILLAISIILNIITVVTIENPTLIPLALNIALNSIYYFAAVLMSLAIADYLYEKLFEYVYNKRALRWAHYALILIAVVYAFLLLGNTTSGSIFYFDENLAYHHGPINNIVYAAPVAEVIILLILAVHWKQGLSAQMRKAVTRIPIAIILLLILQLMFPEQLLNGMISVVACYIIYLCFQSTQVELDTLTGIANRQSFSREVSIKLATKQPCQVILISLRDFALVNSVLGNHGGDAVLIDVAESLKAIEGTGRVYRYSNVGFAMLLNGSTEIVRIRNLEAVTKVMNKDWKYGADDVPLQYVMSELVYSGEDWSEEEFFGYLNYSSQLAKRDNKKVLRFDSKLLTSYDRNEKILRILQQAIKEDNVKVYYQPVLLATTGHFDTAEALLRVRDGEGNQISPEEFVPVAEENGLIDDLSWIAFEHAARLLESKQIPSLQTVNVNLTMPQLMQPDLKDRMIDLLERHNLTTQQLKLEVTEQAIADSGEVAEEAMQAMSDAGFTFLLDDFGTGYSNFQRILKFPFAAIKFDKTLITGIDSDSKTQITADTLIPFFHELGHYVVAEGVETEAQAKVALSYGADFIQGFYYAKPMPSEELIEWYKTHN